MLYLLIAVIFGLLLYIEIKDYLKNDSPFSELERWKRDSEKKN